jgi:HEAT repeat protein
MAVPPHPLTAGVLPRDLVSGAVDLHGRPRVVQWCVELLAGWAADDDPDWPEIAWLGGTVGWSAYWARTWGARGLLHVGPPARHEIVLAALQDESWRVREMSLKVIRRLGLDDPDGLVDRLVDDPVERVRIQAWMALGLPVPHEQQV